MRIALGVEYDGTDFSGWQIQHGARTVQGAVETAVSAVADHSVRVTCAGRTDTGVHATGQVVHFDSHSERSDHAWVFGANANLTQTVTVLWAMQVPDEFHARFAAQRRRYRYVIFNRAVRPAVLRCKVSWYYRPLDTERMEEAARYLVGEHDFSSYRAQECQAKSPVRTVYSLDVRRRAELVFLDIEANAFLHHMVRNIAGVLITIGAGERDPAWAKEVLEMRDRTRGGITAPPQGLYLAGVTYPERFAIPEPRHASIWW